MNKNDNTVETGIALLNLLNLFRLKRKINSKNSLVSTSTQ